MWIKKRLYFCKKERTNAQRHETSLELPWFLFEPNPLPLRLFWKKNPVALDVDTFPPKIKSPQTKKHREGSFLSSFFFLRLRWALASLQQDWVPRGVHGGQTGHMVSLPDRRPTPMGAWIFWDGRVESRARQALLGRMPSTHSQWRYVFQTPMFIRGFVDLTSDFSFFCSSSLKIIRPDRRSASSTPGSSIPTSSLPAASVCRCWTKRRTGGLPSPSSSCFWASRTCCQTPTPRALRKPRPISCSSKTRPSMIAAW